MDQRARRHRLGRIERHGAGEFEKRLGPPALRNPAVDGEYRVGLEERQRERGVEKAHVIERDDRVRSALGDILDPGDLEPEQRAEHHGEKVAQQVGRQRVGHQDHGGEIGDADRQEQDRDRHAEGLQLRDQKRPGHDEGGVEHVDGGDHAGPPVCASPGLDGGENRHDEQAAPDREAGKVDGDAQPARRGEDLGNAGRCGLRQAVGRPSEIEREKSEQKRADQRRKEDDASMREPGGEAGPDGDRDREHGEEDDHHVLVGAEHRLDEHRHQRQRDRADQPEPARRHGAPAQPRVMPELLEEAGGRACDIGIDPQVGRALAGARDQQAGPPAQEREHHDEDAEDRGMMAFLGGEPAHDRAEQDRHEGRAFDQRVAGRELFGGQMVRKDAVFDRAEERGDHAEQEERREQDRYRLQPIAGDRDTRDRDLDELDALRHDRLVEAVRHLAPEAGEEEERADEDRGGERDERAGIGDRGREQDQEDQRVLEEIVIEGAEKLAPEERCEAPGGHQTPEHRGPLKACESCFNHRRSRRRGGRREKPAHQPGHHEIPPGARRDRPAGRPAPSLTSLAVCRKSPTPVFSGARLVYRPRRKTGRGSRDVCRREPVPHLIRDGYRFAAENATGIPVGAARSA